MPTRTKFEYQKKCDVNVCKQEISLLRLGKGIAFMLRLYFENSVCDELFPLSLRFNGFLYVFFRDCRAMELCQELNILSGVSHHEKSAGCMLLTEQEQAK